MVWCGVVWSGVVWCGVAVASNISTKNISFPARALLLQAKKSDHYDMTEVKLLVHDILINLDVNYSYI